MTDEQITFDQLLEVIGTASDKAASLSRALQVDDVLREFVKPDFQLGAPLASVAASRILLIAAPAAVGKSVLARQLGLDSKNPLLDLSGRRIGDAFFTGWLSRKLGGFAALELMSEINAGRATLIVDAADEALVGNGPQDYGVAMQDLAQLIGATEVQRPAVVVLGRPDTIDETARVLTQSGISTARIDVSFFAEEQARAFVRLKALGVGGAGPEQELQDFLGQFFEIVLDAFGADYWKEADSFVGYAPVLDALATFYDPNVNMMRVLQDIKQATTTSHVWGLFIRIIHEVLDRETRKFARSFGGSDEAKFAYGKACFGRDVQLNLLLSDKPLEVPITPDLEPDDESWWIELEKQVRDQFREHPFIGGSRIDSEPNPILRFTNAAFRDYAVASALSEQNDLRARAIRDYWCAPSVAPSPILMRLALSKEMGLKQINPTGLTLLVASHAAEFRDDVMLSIEEVGSPESVAGGVQVRAALSEGGTHVHAVVSVLDPEEAIFLSQGIARTDLDVPSVRVVAGEGAQEFFVGPLADITCAEFSAESPELRLRSSKSDEPSFIEAGRVNGVARRVIPSSPALLKLITSETAYPWSVFRSSRPAGDGVTESEWGAASALQGNARWYIKKSMLKGAPNYPAHVMDNILAKGRASRVVHDFAVERGYITREDDVYFFRLPGFSIRNAVDIDLGTESYVSFLRDLAGWAKAKGESF